jgi:GH35 family endo-1,4-beta-xylanase
MREINLIKRDFEMKSLYQLRKRAEREIKLIENDYSMSSKEKKEAIKEIYEKLREAEKEFEK